MYKTQLTSQIVSTLNSRNISEDSEKTKNIISEIIANCDDKLKEIADFGQYNDIRPIRNSAMEGRISLRLVLSISLILEIDPFIITGSTSYDDFSKVLGTLNENNILKFLQKHEYEEILKEGGDIGVIKKRMINLISNIVNDLELSDIESARSLSKEDLVILIQSHLIKYQNEPNEIKTLLLKLLVLK